MHLVKQRRVAAMTLEPCSTGAGGLGGVSWHAAGWEDGVATGAGRVWQGGRAPASAAVALPHTHTHAEAQLNLLSSSHLIAGTWLVVDGEEVPFTPLCLEVHPRLCSVIVAPPPPPAQQQRQRGSSGPPATPRSRKLS